MNYPGQPHQAAGEGYVLVPRGFDTHAQPGGGANEVIGSSQYACFFYDASEGIGTPAG